MKNCTCIPLLVVYQDVDNLALPSANMKATFRLGNKIFSFLETLSRLFLEEGRDCHEGMVVGEKAWTIHLKFRILSRHLNKIFILNTRVSVVSLTFGFKRLFFEYS